MTYDNLMYCRVTSGMVDAIFCGPFPEGEGLERVPDNVTVSHGDLRAFWDADWNPVPTATLVEQGVIPAPGGYKLLGGKLVELTLAEKIEAGQVVVPTGSVFDGGEIRPMTPQEEGRAGLVAKEVLASVLTGLVDARFEELRRAGFTVAGHRFSATQDQVVNATGLMTALVADVPVSFPLPWPNAEDETVEFETQADFRAYAAALLGYVQTVSQDVGNIKAAIRSASSAAAMADLFDGWAQ